VKHFKRELPGLKVPATPDKEYEDNAKKALLEVLVATGHAYCYMDLKIGDERQKRVILELYQHTCPRTCENFVALCAGSGKLKYKGSVFHRVVAGGWIAGGDVDKGKGNGGESAFGGTFEDETFSVPFDGAGVLAMASKGAHTNGSQFFITTAALPWLKTKAVGFGRVVRGMDVVRKVEAAPCVNERPEEPVRVDKCGPIDITSTYELKL